MQTRRLLQIGWALIASLAMAGCSGASDANGLGASISGVNYTDKDVRYRLFDPTDPEERILVMEDLGPYSAGGVLCCFPLPQSWKPGIKVGVLVDVYDDNAHDYLPRERYAVELPSYDPGKAADVWFIRYPDNSVGVVATNARPNSEGWPGKIKGWPVPSVEYRRKLWERDMELAQEGVSSTLSLIKDFEEDREKVLATYWQSWKRSLKPPVELAMFHGPDDPALVPYMRKRFQTVLDWERAKLDRLNETKP